MSIKPKIRVASQADAEAILDINRQAWSGYTTHELLELRHGVLNGRPWTDHIADAVASHIRSKNVTTFVAEHQGRVIGYATAQINRERASNIGTVSYNAVAPAYRRQGVGTALIQEAMKCLKEQGARVLTVVTLETDEPVRRIYERLGFKELTHLVYYSKEC
jgi:ribosomal protein S18 acetylase RimI-like enzyme